MNPNRMFFLLICIFCLIEEMFPVLIEYIHNKADTTSGISYKVCNPVQTIAICSSVVIVGMPVQVLLRLSSFYRLNVIKYLTVIVL